LFTKKGISILILFCLCIKSLLKEVQSDEKLLFVLEHFRHGARGAYKSFNYNTWRDILNEEWKGSGELTPIGMRQHYLLGTSIRNKYKNFISNEFNPNEIYAISSDVNRTLISAYSNLLGIFHLLLLLLNLLLNLLFHLLLVGITH